MTWVEEGKGYLNLEEQVRITLVKGTVYLLRIYCSLSTFK